MLWNHSSKYIRTKFQRFFFNGRDKSMKQIYGMGLGFRALSEQGLCLVYRPDFGRAHGQGLCCMYNLSLFFLFFSFLFMIIGENIKHFFFKMHSEK
jgi:hypothetical protein